MRHCEAAVEGSKFVAVLFEWQARLCILNITVHTYSHRCYARLIYLLY